VLFEWGSLLGLRAFTGLLLFLWIADWILRQNTEFSTTSVYGNPLNKFPIKTDTVDLLFQFDFYHIFNRLNYMNKLGLRSEKAQ